MGRQALGQGTEENKTPLPSADRAPGQLGRQALGQGTEENKTLPLAPAKRSALLPRELAHRASQNELTRPWREQITITHGRPE